MNYEDKLKRICNDKGYKKYGFDIEEKIVSKSNISYSRYVCTLNYK